jgi:uncharacterized membrane protein (UPF0127 family)
MGENHRLAVSLAVLVALLLLPGSVVAQTAIPWRAPLPEANPRDTIEVGEETLRVELALDSRAQTLGLGYRNGLEPGTGMLFVFDGPSIQTFWMKGMRFCLDIVWIEDGVIVGAAERVCPDPPGTEDANRVRVNSPEPVTYVLEVPAGWLDERGYGAGTQVEIPETITTPDPER